ncbi:trypsin-like serine protease [Novipirellula aureliae]|nr:trypsin-like serine protease [Novipirellula aureliae]
MNISKLTALCTSVIAFTCFAISANAGLVHSLDPDYVDSNGQGYLDRAASHPYVGWQSSTDDSIGETRFRQSGVLINPRWVITSIHGVVEGDNNLNAIHSNIRMGFGSNYFTDFGETLYASEVFLHPSYTDVGQGYDLALLYFENPFTSVAPVHLYGDTVAVGMESDIVGFGYNLVEGEATPTPDSYTGDRMAGTNTITNVGFRPNYVGTRFDGAGWPEYQPLGMGGLPGDSGGGLIIGGELAGISSFTSTNNSYGRNTYYSLIDIDWVNETMALHPSAVPEPSSVLLLLAAAPMVAFVRKRKAASLNHAA